MKLFSALAAAAVLVGSFVAIAPASAQYNNTYTIRNRVNGFQVRDSYGNSTTYRNRVEGGYRYNSSNGASGNIRFRYRSIEPHLTHTTPSAMAGLEA